MADLHLYTPTYLNEIGNPVTFTLYVSSAQYQAPAEILYSGGTIGVSGVNTYTLPYSPVDPETLTLELKYGATTINLVSARDVIYNDSESILMMDAGAATPSPSAYLDYQNSVISIVATNTNYNSIYLTGPDRILAVEGYAISPFFAYNFPAGAITIDYGDETITSYQYSGTEADTFSHTYSTADIYTVSTTAEFVTGSNPSDSITLTKVCTSVIEIVDEIETVYRDVIRINGSSIVTLPYPQAKIPVSEWIDAIPINSVFQKLYDNFKYIEDATAIYQVSPLKYYGWGAIERSIPGYSKIEWHSEHFASSEIESLSSYANITDIWSLNNDTYDNLYIGRTDRVERYTYNHSDRSASSDTAASLEGDTPTRVKSIATDSRDRIYILDSRRLLVKVYAYNSTLGDYVPIFEWGGLGGVTGNTKFYKPNDLFISNDKVFIVDSGNNCIKRFTLGGQWEYTYICPDTSNSDIDDGAPISATLDIDNNLYVVTKTNVVKFSYTGDLIFDLPIQMLTSVPVSVRHHNGFIYILTTTDVIRIFPSGESTNTFATRSLISNELNDYTKIHIDINGNVYITDGTIILRFVDSPVLLDATPRSIDETWTFDEMKIKPNEFVSSLTYNKFFNKLYDNLNTIFHTIEYKVIRNSNNTLAIAPLENCDIGAFEGLPIYKEEIYIGLNEIVTPEVLNRCIRQILIVEQYILDVIMNKYSGCNTGYPASFRVENPILLDCCWSWESRRTALCCLTWDRLSGLTTTWQDATGCCVQIT